MWRGVATKRVGTGAGVAKKRASRRVKKVEDRTAAARKPDSSESDNENRRPVRNPARLIDTEFRRDLPLILEALSKESRAGSTAHSRLYFFLWNETSEDAKPKGRRGGKTLSGLLLDELKRRQDTREAAVDAGEPERAETACEQAKGAAIDHAGAG